MTELHHGDELITVWRCGVHFTASRRTVQHLDWTIARLKKRYPWARLHILQPCYHTGYELSKGTHDYDAVFDFRISGLTWRHGERFLRNAGWFAWWRHTGSWADKHAWHLHAGSLPPRLPVAHPNAEQVGRAYASIGPHGTQVGEFIDGGWTTTNPHKIEGSSQVVDYMASPPRDGLADHALDTNSYHPRDIRRTVFSYSMYKEA